jgi:hypothetical protein
VSSSLLSPIGWRRVSRGVGRARRGFAGAQTEQTVDGLSVGDLRFFVGQRLQLLGGFEEQLLDDQARHFVDARSRVRRQTGQFAVETLEFGSANRVETLTERDDSRYGPA